MNNEEINRYLHVEIMGKCWHEFPKFTDENVEIRCLYCGLNDWPQTLIIAGDTAVGIPNPDYCSDDSPRRLLNEVVAKATATDGGWHEFITAYEAVKERSGLQITACIRPAEQIATACVEAHKLTTKAAA